MMRLRFFGGEDKKEEDQPLDRYFEKGGLLGSVRAAEARLEEERALGERRFVRKGEPTGIVDGQGNEILANEDHEETEREFAARQKNRREWGRHVKEVKDADGTVRYEIEGATDYRQRLETLGPTSWREADAAARAALSDMPEGWLERLFFKVSDLRRGKSGPEMVAELAPYATHEEWMRFTAAMEKINLKTKNEARETRMGGWKRGVLALDAAVKSGTILEGTAEYDDRVLELFNMAKKNIRYADEWVDFVTSEAGESLRSMPIALRAVPTSFYKALVDSGRVAPSEKRIMDEAQRPYLEPQRIWAGAQTVLGGEGSDTPSDIPADKGEDRFHPVEDAQKWAEERTGAATRVIKNFEAGGAVSVATKEEAEEDLVLARLITLNKETGRTIDQLSAEEIVAVLAGTRFSGSAFRYGGSERSVRSLADQKRFLRMLARRQADAAEERIKRYAGRETAKDIADGMQDKSLYHPIMAQIDVSKMMEVQAGQDSRFIDKWVENKLVYGSSSEIYRIAANDEISVKFHWPSSKEVIDTINARRKKRLQRLNRRRADEGYSEEDRRPLSEAEADIEPLPYSPADFVARHNK